MGSFKRVFDPLDLEIIDRVYEVAWAQVQARQPNRDTVSVFERQEALRKRIFGVARILGSGHIDFDTLAELVLATVPDCSRKENSTRQPRRLRSARTQRRPKSKESNHTW
jgi:hypothetical protein